MYFQHLIDALAYLLSRQYCYYMYLIPAVALLIYFVCYMLGFDVKKGGKYVN